MPAPIMTTESQRRQSSKSLYGGIPLENRLYLYWVSRNVVVWNPLFGEVTVCLGHLNRDERVRDDLNMKMPEHENVTQVLAERWWPKIKVSQQFRSGSFVHHLFIYLWGGGIACRFHGFEAPQAGNHWCRALGILCCLKDTLPSPKRGYVSSSSRPSVR